MSIRPVSIPYSTDAQCPLCLTNPFEEDLAISSHSWNGHSITIGSGTEAEKKIIHGICVKCLPSVPRNEHFLRCFECRIPFPDGRRSEIVVRRDGRLIRETLLPPIENRNAPHAFGEAFPTRPYVFFAIAGTSFIAYLAAELAASSTTTTYLFPAAHLAVRVTEWTPTTVAAAAAVPVLISVSLGALGLGMLACLGDAFMAQGRQRERRGL
ncbi:MAG: hypothetical protein NTX49_02865 [Chlamydiae bacterium]|nr:hypothetical protein [Chlamydiota bacterium]